MVRPDTIFRAVCEKGHATFAATAPWVEKDVCQRIVGWADDRVCHAPLVTLDRYECVTEPEPTTHGDTE